MISLSSYVKIYFFFILAAVALCVCRSDYGCPGTTPPNTVLTWGIDQIVDGYVSGGVLDGWKRDLGYTDDQFEEARQEALRWYAERYGLNNTVISYDPTTGISVLAQGLQIPVLLNGSGHYNLWSASGEDDPGRGCLKISVIELVYFLNPSEAGKIYGGTYGDWAKVKDPAGSPISLGDVVSFGRYLIRNRRGRTVKVMKFWTWYPVRKDFENSYRVDNVLQDSEWGQGYGQCSYRNYPIADQSSALPGVTRYSSQSFCVQVFPARPAPPIMPSS